MLVVSTRFSFEHFYLTAVKNVPTLLTFVILNFSVGYAPEWVLSAAWLLPLGDQGPGGVLTQNYPTQG